MRQTSERAHHLQSSLIRDVAEKGMQMQDILPLWFGEGQWPTSQIAIEAAQNIEQGRFPRPGWPHDGRIRALFDIEIQPVQGRHLDRAKIINLGQILDLDDVAGGHVSSEYCAGNSPWWLT